MDDQPNLVASPFDAIRRVDERGREYWNAKDLAKLLGYSEYSKFKNVIRKAEKACEESREAVADHFVHLNEPTRTGRGAIRSWPTVHLSRYACYLVIENSDPDGRPIVAIGQRISPSRQGGRSWLTNKPLQGYQRTRSA